MTAAPFKQEICSERITIIFETCQFYKLVTRNYLVINDCYLRKKFARKAQNIFETSQFNNSFQKALCNMWPILMLCSCFSLNYVFIFKPVHLKQYCLHCITIFYDYFEVTFLIIKFSRQVVQGAVSP